MSSPTKSEDCEEQKKLGLRVDAIKTWRRIQHHENELCLKRKFLMGFSELDSCDQNVKSCDGKQLVIPESILRKDDIFYEDVKKIVEKSFFQSSDSEATHSVIDDDDHDDQGLKEVKNMSKFISTFLDDLSNNGMYNLAKILTRGSITFCRTRPKMRRVIKNILLNLKISHLDLDSKYYDQMKNELFQLLENPNNFHQNHGKHMKFSKKSLNNAFHKIEFQSIPVRILYAMYRRLKGRQVVIPQLRPSALGWKRDRLIDQVRKSWAIMVNQLDESNKIQDSLVKALTIPGLYAKIDTNSRDLYLEKFIRVTPEIEELQNEIIKAVKSLGSRKRFDKEELKTLQLLLDPKSNVDVNGLRRAIKNMLIDFFIESSDMEVIPESLFDALTIINKKSRKLGRSSKDIIEEDVECILNVSAHIKQLVWDRVSLDKIDRDFEDAYMEDFEESDDGDIFDDDSDDDDDDDHHHHRNVFGEVRIRFNDFIEEVASTCDGDRDCSSLSSSAFNNDNNNTFIRGSNESSLLVSPLLRGNVDMEKREDRSNTGLVGPVNFLEKCSKQNSITEFQRNRYVDIQEVCDQTSLFAHQIIGQILADFGQKDALDLNKDDELYLRGDYKRSKNFRERVDSKDKRMSEEVILQAVHKVIPSFPSSELEKVKKFMNS